MRWGAGVLQRAGGRALAGCVCSGGEERERNANALQEFLAVPHEVVGGRGARASLLSGALLKIACALDLAGMPNARGEGGPEAQRHAARLLAEGTSTDLQPKLLCHKRAASPGPGVSCSPVSCASTNACPPAPSAPLHSYTALAGSTSTTPSAPAPRFVSNPCSRPRPSTTVHTTTTAMKRKFSLNLAPIVSMPHARSHEPEPELMSAAQKVPTKQENRALKESLATRDISTPSSPYVNRRMLSPKVEAELRAACEAVLNEDGNSYGAAAALQAQESSMDFLALQRSMKAMEQAQKQSSHRRTGSHPPSNPLPRRDVQPTESTARLPSNAFAYKPDAALRDLFPEHGPYPIHANMSRRREGYGTAHDTKSSRNISGKHRDHHQDHSATRYVGYDRPSTAPIGRGVDSPDTNYSTPMSASTMEHHRNNASTAMTSADPSRTSKRNSHHMFSDEDAASRADAAASSWMRHEYERRKEGDLDRRPSTRTSRAASVTKSIKSEIKEYFRPGSSGLSRATSRESLRSRSSDATAAQAPAQHGWRSWSLQRRPSDTSLNSRSSSIRGRNDVRSKESKKEINLNRELPPLPSLDQWKDPEEDAPAHRVPVQKPISPKHIANLMQTPPKTRTRSTHIAHQQSVDRRQRRPDDVSRKSSLQHQARPAVRATSSDPEVPMHFQPRTEDSIARDLAQSHELMSMRYGPSNDAINRSSPSLVDSGHSPDEPDQNRKPSMKISIDHFRGEAAPNFSKKITAEKPAEYHGQEPRYKYKAEIKANNTLATKSPGNPKGLKKMFSHLGLGGRREKKETWMDKFEKNGVKGGILIHDEAAGSPIVRY